MKNLKMINRYFLESKDNIKDWFQKNLAPNPRMKQFTHIIANNQVNILNLDVSIFKFLVLDGFIGSILLLRK